MHERWLEDQSFWGATRCVLALRLDPEDLATWVLINECGVDVRILVATCAKTREECFQRGSESWWYAFEGIFLPAKYKRSVALEKQTVRGQYLRYIACRVNAPASSQLDRQAGALRQVGMQSCDEEVRSLAQLGSQSRAQIEEVVNEPVPANPCCTRSE